MANEQNLKKFKPGQSGNPNGRPKGAVSITTELKRLMQARAPIKDPITHKPMTGSKAVAWALYKSALEGKAEALKELIERIDGKVPQKNEISGPEQGPIQLDTNLSPETLSKIDAYLESVVEQPDTEQLVPVEPDKQVDTRETV